jgi:hypothetical protein
VRIFLGEIERNRQRLRDDDIAVGDQRQPAVRIDCQEFRPARPGLADLDRNVLVSEPKLFGNPQGAKRALRATP